MSAQKTYQNGDGNWNEWSRHVLAELKRLNECYGELKKDLYTMGLDIRELKIKSGVWGFCGAAVALLLAWVMKKL